MEDYVKRFVTKDGKKRVTIYREECADNPRYNTDEPLHCNDWCRNFSIMTKDERNGYSSARSLLNQMLVWYGKREVIIDALCKGIDNNKLVYNRSMRRWELKEYKKFFGDKEYKWYDAEWFDGRKDDIDLGTLIEACLDSTIDELCYFKYWTDGVKTASYSFGYYGEISFSDEISCDSDGICWLEKEEFLKYSGCDEEYWKGKTLKEIEWLTDEIEAWSNNEVYGFRAEKAVRKIVNTRYPDGEHDDTESEEVDWEETDSCWGFYGELSKNLEFILSDAGFKKEDLIEE